MLFKVLLISTLYAFTLSYPLQQGCICTCHQSCCGDCCSSQQNEPVTTTTTTEAPQTAECCCDNCCNPQQDAPTTTTTQASIAQCCDKCCSSQQDEPVTTTTQAAVQCSCCCCETPQEAPIITTTESPSCCCGGTAGGSVKSQAQYPAQNGGTRRKLANSPLQYAAPNANTSAKSIRGKCPIGFKRFGSSCYFVELERLTFSQAERNCIEMGATLFAPETEQEWREVMTLAPLYAWTWSGITQNGMDQTPQWKGTSNTMNAATVNWLIKPFSSISNGWSMISKCAAYYNLGLEQSNYVYYYSCMLPFFSICEKPINALSRYL
ncbi:lectin C-type domain protein [Dictyocaulus viviparus]|uniref:Lectin C-type domain protein n=1 Tax=Dictyocaulus viviparus TaxID=29172 RepID=A0A0D8Y3W5_DICVI|nr:lectin C-type domain protein [Dictyocaulus viviparus]